MDESSGQGQKRQIIIALSVLIVVAVIVGGVAVMGGKDESLGSGGQGVASTSNREAVNPNATYKDGTYEATGGYASPGGNQKIAVSITVQDNVVTGTSAESGATDTESKVHQQDFIEHYRSEVVGKKLNEVNLSRVSGSSLTSQGFHDALQQIQNQAEI